MNIDHIAREMVDVEPSVDLEARVRLRLRLDEARPNRTAAWWLWRVGAPLAASTALGLAALYVVGVQESRSLPAEAAPPGAVAQAGPGVVTSVGVRGSRSPGVVRTSQPPKVPASQLTSEELAWMDRRLPALDPGNALQMERLRVDSIQPEPLAITPLTMTPVGTDNAGGERRHDR